MPHLMEVEERVTSVCSEGCHKSYGSFVVCSCGWEKRVYEVSEYRHKDREPMAELVKMMHRLDVLEGAC